MRTIITCVVMVMCVVSVYACDICGSGAGNAQLGILPNYLQNFVGLRYRSSAFQSSHYNDANTLSQDFFQTAEVFIRYVPHRRVQIFGFVPFNLNKSIKIDDTQQLQGLGDASILANIIIWNNSDNADAKWKHALQMSGGVKLPTGKCDTRHDGRLLPIGLQLGSGSTDLLLNLSYTVRYKKAGMSLETNYRHNTANADKYQQGSRLSGSGRFFYWQSIKKTVILPHLGASYETAKQDHSRNNIVVETGGTAWLGNAGVDVFYGQYALGLQLQTPLYQNLNGGNTQGSPRVAAQFLYLFSFKK